jgi:hypothetical protein
MDTPVDGSTPATAQRLQQALAQRSGGQLHLDPGGP